MRFLKSDSRLIGVLLVLAITQLIGWGTIVLPAIVGRDLATVLILILVLLGRRRPQIAAAAAT